jgi:FKBP-type peptidyl-prolyl cis-trans isomerase
MELEDTVDSTTVQESEVEENHHQSTHVEEQPAADIIEKDFFAELMDDFAIEAPAFQEEAIAEEAAEPATKPKRKKAAKAKAIAAKPKQAKKPVVAAANAFAAAQQLRAKGETLLANLAQRLK